MRVIILVALLLSLTLGSESADSATTRHKYHRGIVSSFGGNQVSIESGTYTLMPAVKVVLITRESNGARYERKGRLSDVGAGKRVYLKAVGNMVSEIVVER